MIDKHALDLFAPLLREFQLSPDYPRDVMRETAEIINNPGIDDPALQDMTDLPFVTIDYEDSFDLDQAMQIDRGPNGQGYILRYALADASYYVRPGTALWDEALRRGSSFYLPGLTISMLPKELSEGIISLNARQDRRAVVFVIRLDQRGNTAGCELVRARIHSQAKLTYDGVQARYDRPAQSPLSGQPFSETLDLLAEIGRLRMDEARSRDVVMFNRRELDIRLAAAGSDARFELHEDTRNGASRFNEQVSLLCNIEGGGWLLGRGKPQPHVQPVFRVHEPPDRGSLQHLEQIIRRIASAHDIPRETAAWRRQGDEHGERESLAVYLERLRASRISRRVVDAVERQALVTNRRSQFSAEPGLHYALAVRPYARFSAPMREMVGIFTHKEAMEKLGLAQAGSASDDERTRDLVIRAANRAKDVQRKLNKQVMRMAIDDLFGRQPDNGPLHRGTILGIRPSRLYVRLDDPPVELKVYTRDLERVFGSPFVLSDDDVELRATKRGSVRFALGDAITLRNETLDTDRNRWRLVPIN